MDYPVETFTETEAARLAPHVTSLHAPVFALTNLPETVKAAMFARYSRYQGTLRRLYLDEFADTLPAAGRADGDEGERAAGIFDRIFTGFGDDSVADLGGAHLAVEWCSNVLTKVLQRPRIASYLEQSTRYIAFDQPIDAAGRYRYWRPAGGNPAYEQAMDSLFETYRDLLADMTAWAAEQFPRGDEPEAAWRRAIAAKALDCVRGLLPAASLSHMGIYATGRTYEQLVLHLLAHPLPEARACADMMLTALQQVIPSFLARVQRPDRGGVWVDYLQQRRAAGERWADRLDLRRDTTQDQGPSVTLRHVDGDETALLTALMFEETGVDEGRLRAAVEALPAAERAGLLADLAGDRVNRRHKPGRGLEALRYRFEVVSDYGAFRDLQRHRMLTCQWQTLTPDLGAEIPPEVEAAGCGDRFRAALDRSASAYEQLLQSTGQPMQSAYALCLAYRIRYVLDLNAREAMHLIELRSGAAGHPAYRAVALEMHRQIAEHHPAVAALMGHVDRTSDPRLERIGEEIRNQRRRADG